MGSTSSDEYKPHAVCIPYPAQGHVTPMLKLAKLLHYKGFYITFINTEYNHRRLLNSRGGSALQNLPDFRFATIPDGLPPSDANATQDIPALCVSTTTKCLEPFCDLLSNLNNSGPPVTCIVSDGVMSFTLKGAERFRLPEVLFWTTSACGLLGYTHYRNLITKGYVPFKDMGEATNGYLETTVDWAEGMKDMRLRDFPSFIRTTDRNDIMLNFLIQESDAIPRAKALILNTFDDLEHPVLSALSAMFPKINIYTIGPLQLMLNHLNDHRLAAFTSSLWKEDTECMTWLDSKPPHSVVYVNFGSITVMSAHQLTEFAWGLANSRKHFLWIIRPDVVAGDTAMLPPEFLEETRDRGMMVSWCPQERVLNHPAVGGFLTHSGWNSTIESIAGGVSVVCWPFFAEQQTNCRFSCVEWGMGMEIDNDVRREEVEAQVRELMDGEKGRRMREKAAEWKKKAHQAAAPGGSSYLNFDKLLNDVLLLN